MKATWLLFLTIGCAAFTPGTGYAAPSQQTHAESSAKTLSGHPRDAEHATSVDDRKRQKQGNPADEHRNVGKDSDKNRPSGHASMTSANRPKYVPSRQEHSTPGNAMKLDQLSSAKSGGATRGAQAKNDKVRDVRLVRPQSLARTSTPSFDNLRHLGPNPAIVGGSVNSGSRNTGAISGTGMKRRP